MKRVTLYTEEMAHLDVLDVDTENLIPEWFYIHCLDGYSGWKKKTYLYILTSCGILISEIV